MRTGIAENSGHKPYLYRMNRVLIWVFALQFITGHNLLAEMVRTPSLFEHYETHRRETPDLSFAGFIWLHYCNTNHEQSDSRHGQLPMHCAHVVIAESVLPQAPTIVPLPYREEPDRRNQIPVAGDSVLPDNHGSGLFRPPIA